MGEIRYKISDNNNVVCYIFTVIFSENGDL